jgi:hypothetical protein
MRVFHTSSIPVIFADDTSVIISSKNLNDFYILSNKVHSQMSKWFSPNKLSLNLDNTNVINFIIKNSQYPLNFGYNDKYIEEVVNTKFLGLQIDNHLNWKTPYRSAGSKACYVVRSMLHISNTDTLKSIYFASFRSSMKYDRDLNSSI